MYTKKTNVEAEFNRRKNTKCFCCGCGQWGHISRNCKEAKQQNQNSTKIAVDPKTSVALLADEDESKRKNLWILDSRATDTYDFRSKKIFKP